MWVVEVSMYDLGELTDLIHGDPTTGMAPLDPGDADDVGAVVALTYEDDPVGRLLDRARADGLLADVAVALAALGAVLRDADQDVVVDATALVVYAAKLPAPVGPWLIGIFARGD